MIRLKPLPPVELLRRMLAYDPVTGVLLWKARTPDMFNSMRAESLCDGWNKRYVGAPALTEKDAKGYAIGSILGQMYKSHRIAWAIHFGREPLIIDHVNGLKSDNRLENLRETDQLGNNRNQKCHSTNRYGIPGVCRSINGKSWRAYIGHGKRRRHLGTFRDYQDALFVRKKAERDLGYHPNHGRI